MEMEDKLLSLLEEQVELSNNIKSTSEFLRFVLNVSSQNLKVIHGQLENIRQLAETVQALEAQQEAGPQSNAGGADGPDEAEDDRMDAV